jgi:hypothetical protein
MIGTDLHTEKNCVVLGGLDGGRFVTTLSALRSNLSRLETFVGDQSEAFDVAPRPIVSLGYEVDRDAIVINHLDESLCDVISGLLDLRVAIGMARSALQKAERAV